MKKAIELLQEYWNDNAEEIEYMEIGNPELDNVLKENEELQEAIKILKQHQK